MAGTSAIPRKTGLLRSHMAAMKQKDRVEQWRQGELMLHIILLSVDDMQVPDQR
jgi:hypothetical protein